MSVFEISTLAESFQVTVTGVPSASSSFIVHVKVWSTAVVICLLVDVTTEMILYCKWSENPSSVMKGK